MDVIAGLSARLAAVEQQDRSLQVQRSDELAQQQVELSQTIVNLSAIRAEAGAEMAEYNRQRESAAVESRAQLEAQANAIDALKGSVTSTTELMQQRSNAVLDELTAAERRQERLRLQQTENSNGIEANRDTLRAVTGTDFASEIEIAVRRSYDDQLEPEMEKLVERKYVLLAPTSGSDGYDPKRDDLTKPFLAEEVGDNPTEHAVNRALRNVR